MRRTHITATIIAVALALWLFSGEIGRGDQVEHPTLAEANRIRAAEEQDQTPVRVRGRVIHAAPQTASVVLRGRTENKRTVEVKAETTGRIVARPVDRGTEVDQGDLLCRISVEDREAVLERSREEANQARIEYEGSLTLQERGLLSETGIAQARARLAAARAEVKRSELDLARTEIRAPFQGIVEDVQLEVGDYVTPGAACVTLVDMDPMLLIGRVSERDVQKLTVDTTATGVLNDGRRVQGAISFVGQQSDPATRTYGVEVEIPNPDRTLRSGITTAIHVPVAEIMAHKISPALFALSDEGGIGVRVVNENDRVAFHDVEIVREDSDGVWVSGLPEITTLITVGQELVVHGQQVQVVYDSAPGPAMPARAPDPERPPASSTVEGASGKTINIAAKP